MIQRLCVLLHKVQEEVDRLVQEDCEKDIPMKRVLVTGASTPLGELLIEHLINDYMVEYILAVCEQGRPLTAVILAWRWFGSRCESKKDS